MGALGSEGPPTVEGLSFFLMTGRESEDKGSLNWLSICIWVPEAIWSLCLDIEASAAWGALHFFLRGLLRGLNIVFWLPMSPSEDTATPGSEEEIKIGVYLVKADAFKLTLVVSQIIISRIYFMKRDMKTHLLEMISPHESPNKLNYTTYTR